jgi:hypothetical protein
MNLILKLSGKTFLTISLLLLGALTTFANGQITMIVTDPDPTEGNHSWFVYESTPGQTLHDLVTLKNYGNETATVNLYGVDATSGESGNFILTFKDQEQKNIGNWIKVDQETITIPANESIDVPFRLEIPEGVSPGQYTGGLVVETTAENNTNENNKNVQVKTRIGSRIYVTVPGEIVEEINLNNFSVNTTLQNKLEFKFEIQNNGNISYETHANIEIYDLQGNLFDRINMPMGTSSPETTIKPTLLSNKKALMGNFNIKGSVNYIPKFVTSNLHGAALSDTFTKNYTVLPWNIIAITGFLLFMTLYIVWHKKHQKKLFFANSTNYILKCDDDIISLGKKNHIPWKKLARYNHLKPPFILKEGDSILVPKNPDNA